MDFWTDAWSGRRVDDRIYVVAGTERETRAALRAAGEISATSGRPIVVLVPHIVPYGTELNRCGHDLQQLAAGFPAAAECGGPDIKIRVCACREAYHLFARIQVQEASIVIAGARGRWRRSAPERLAGRLQREGHRITFIDVDRPQEAAPGMFSSGGRSSLRTPVPRSASVRSPAHSLQDFMRQVSGALEPAVSILKATRSK